jgi:hypothetical protein
MTNPQLLAMIVALCLSLSACSKEPESIFFSQPHPDSRPPNERPDLYSETRLFTYVIGGRTYKMPQVYKEFDSWWGNDNAKIYYPKVWFSFYMYHPNFKGISHEQADVLRLNPRYGRYESKAIAQKYARSEIHVLNIFPLSEDAIDILHRDRLSGEEVQKREARKSMRDEVWKDVGIVQRARYGLQCASPGSNLNLIDCEGVSLKGENIRVNCEEGRWFGYEIGACSVGHSSLEEGYHAYYEFAMDLLPHWQEIHSAVFSKMKSWEQK